MPKKSIGSEEKVSDVGNIPKQEQPTAESAALPVEDDLSEFSEVLYERMNLIVSSGQESIRLDKFLTARIENISRNKVQQAIDGGRVLVNNRTASANYKIRPTDNIVCFSD